MTSLSKLLSEIHPYVLGWIRDKIETQDPKTHTLSGAFHTGTLADSQATQFLKTDGTRGLTGNLAVSASVTIDGVDISVFKTDYDIHIGTDSHSQYVHISNARSISAQHTFSPSSTQPPFVLAPNAQAQTVLGLRADQLNKSISVSGLGLSGGGTMTADRTITLTSSSNPGAEASILASTVLGGLTLVDLTLTNNLITHRVAGHLIPSLVDTYDLGSSTLLWRKGWLSELDTILFAQNTLTLLGGWFVVSKDEGTLAANLSSADTVCDFGKTMTPGHFVVMRSTGKVEYFRVGSLVSGTTYRIGDLGDMVTPGERNLDGSGNNDWPEGQPFLVLGTTGDGRIELNAYDTPRIQILSQGATYNSATEVLRLGDLNGNWGYNTQTYGVALGEYATSKANLIWDPTNGLRLRTHETTVLQLDNSGNADITGKLRMPGTDSAIAIGATPPTGPATGTGIWIDRNGLYGLNNNILQIRITNTGKLTAGGGITTLDENGIKVESSSGAKGSTIYEYGFKKPDATTVGGTYSYYSGATSSTVGLYSKNEVASSFATTKIQATATSYASIILESETGSTAATATLSTYGPALTLGAETRLNATKSLLVGESAIIPDNASILVMGGGTIFGGLSVGANLSLGNGVIYAHTSYQAYAQTNYTSGVADRLILHNIKNTPSFLRSDSTKMPLLPCPPWVAAKGWSGIHSSYNPLVQPDFGFRDEMYNARHLTAVSNYNGHTDFGFTNTITGYLQYHGTNGTNTWYSNASNGTIYNGASNVYILMWFYVTTTGARGLFQFGSVTHNVLAYTNANSQVVFDVTNSGGTLQQLISSNTYQTNAWNYAFFRFSHGTTNGQQIDLNGTVSFRTPPTGAPRTASGDFRLGWASTGNQLNGQIGWTVLSNFQSGSPSTYQYWIDMSRPWHGH
jgi:hypothetical protein